MWVRRTNSDVCGEACASPHHSVRQYVCFHQHLSLEENKICPSPMTTGVPVVWFESITLLILWRLRANSRAWRIVPLHTPYVGFNVTLIYFYIYFRLFAWELATWGNVHKMERIHARNLVQEPFQLAAVKSQAFFHNLWRTAGSCSHVYFSCWITSLCFSEQEIPHLTNVHWITPWWTVAAVSIISRARLPIRLFTESSQCKVTAFLGEINMWNSYKTRKPSVTHKSNKGSCSAVKTHKAVNFYSRNSQKRTKVFTVTF